MIPAGPVRDVPAADDGCAIFLSLRNRTVNLVQPGLIDQWPHVKIVVDGRIVELGSHDELVVAGGVYGSLHASWVGNTRSV